MSKQHGHYCRICKQRKANEKFSGKGHAAHICKECAKRGNKPPDFEPDVAYIEDEEAFFAAYEFSLDIIPKFGEEWAVRHAIDPSQPKTSRIYKGDVGNVAPGFGG